MTRFIPYITLLIVLLPWLYMQINTITPGDAAFLAYSAELLINGLSMEKYYFDSNPVMSILIYTPVVLLKNSFSIPIYLASNIYCFIVITISLISVQRIINYDTQLPEQTKFILMSSCLLAVTIPIITEFGQKDHLIAIALIPFIMYQRAITQNPKEQKISTLIKLLLFTPFILIKPHYGIIPTAIILHRAISQKRIKTAFDVDVIALAIGTCTYIAYTIVFQPNYLEIVLPTALKLYATAPTPNNTTPYKTLVFLAFTLSVFAIIKLTSTTTNQENANKNLSLFFAACAVLSVIPFGVQNKGFSIHLTPTIILSLISIGLYIPILIKKRSSSTISILIVALTLYGYIYTAFISKGYPITHKRYLESDIVKTIKKYTKDGDSLFIEDKTTCAAYPSILYTDNTFASRLPSLWWLNGALTIKDKNEKIEILDQFGKYYAEDFNRFKPKMIAFMLDESRKSPLQVIYDKHDPFQNALSNYKYEETIEINDIYPCYRGEEKENKILVLKIYTRKE